MSDQKTTASAEVKSDTKAQPAPRRKLGKVLGGLDVSALGLGCMGMSWAYGKPEDKESIRVLHRSLELGMNFWDTAEIYGPFANEELIGAALKGQARDRVLIATKFAWRFNEKNERTTLDSSPAHVKKAIEGSLKRLGTDYIDLYYQHRLDPATPIEETMQALSDLVKQGKVRHVGLSEVGPAIIRRAHRVHPLTAVQSEYSLWERSMEEKVLPTLRELGIGFVPYSPMGRGFLTGQVRSLDQLEEGDSRRSQPRFQGENLARNLALVDDVQQIARDNDATPAQVALAWLLEQGDDLVPIPGTKRLHYLEENARAMSLRLKPESRERLAKTLAAFKTSGDRYAPAMMQILDHSE